MNVVIKEGKLVSYTALVKGKEKDSLNYFYSFKGAIGINKKRNADVAWIFTDSLKKMSMASQVPIKAREPIIVYCDLPVWKVEQYETKERRWYQKTFKKWKISTAIGGGPVLLQNSAIMITKYEERMFPRKAINDKHPHTAMGYTR